MSCDKANRLDGLVGLGRHVEAGAAIGVGVHVVVVVQVLPGLAAELAVRVVDLGQFEQVCAVRAAAATPHGIGCGVLSEVVGGGGAVAAGPGATRGQRRLPALPPRRRLARRLLVHMVLLLHPTFRVIRALHEQYPRQIVKKDDAYPAGHPVSPGRAEVPVDDNYRDENRKYIHDEREKQVLRDKGDGDRRRGQDLGNQQQKHHQGEQDGDTHGHLLARVRREVEDADGQERDEHARDDQVHSVEERLAAHGQFEGDLRAVVHLCAVPRVRVVAGTLDDVPRTRVDVVAQVHFVLPLVPVQLNLQRIGNN